MGSTFIITSSSGQNYTNLSYILADGATAWPGVGFSCFFLFGSWELLCGGFFSEWPTMQWSPIVWAGNLAISRTGVHDTILDCYLCIFGWLWLNSYGNAFSQMNLKKSSLKHLSLFHSSLKNFVKPVSDLLTKQRKGDLLY